MDQEEKAAQTPEGGRRRLRPFSYVLAGLVTAAVAFGVYLGIQKLSSLSTPISQPEVVVIPPEATAELRRISESFREIAKQVGPAVVNLSVKRGPEKKHPSMGQPSPHEDHPLFEFFERFGLPFPHGDESERGPEAAVGSGFIVDKSGILVTNNHVVEKASSILVKIGNDTAELKAKILGSDPRTDIAVLQIEKPGEYPVVAWADSSGVEVGDWAVAIGSPFSLGQTTTVGIVSAKGRNAAGLSGNYGGELIQTDAAINPGNSGGPLCNLDGQVIGVNTAIYTRSGGYMGIGFAIPSDSARDITGRLIKEGKIVRGWLGVYIQPLENALMEELGITNGVGIHEVIHGSPAAKAGLQAGDILLAINGEPAKDVTSVQREIGDHKPGQVLKIRIMSYATRKVRNLSVKIAVLPDQETTPDAALEEFEDPLGLRVAASNEGITIQAVEPGSPAEGILEQGDVIVRINRVRVDSLVTYKKLVSGSKHLYLEVNRDGRTLFFQLILPG